MKKKALKMTSWSFSEFFLFIFFRPPTLNLKKNSRKSTNKKFWPYLLENSTTSKWAL